MNGFETPIQMSMRLMPEMTLRTAPLCRMDESQVVGGH